MATKKQESMKKAEI